VDSASAPMKIHGHGNSQITEAAAMQKHSSDSATALVRPQPLSSVSAIALAMMPRNTPGSAASASNCQHTAIATLRAMNTRRP
jgi:hypothetical protein